jgi:lactoylglutathione lyase
MPCAFTHVRLLVSDVLNCLPFYRDMLGLPVFWDDGEGNYVAFDTGEVVLALNRRQSMMEALGQSNGTPQLEVQDPVVLVFKVDDVDLAYAELNEKGVAFITEPTDRPRWGIRTAHFRDPDGNLIEINKSL